MADLTILDRPLNKTKASEVSFSALAQIFSGYISSSKEIVTDISELEAKLYEIGKSVGLKLYELNLWRDKTSKKESQLLNVLLYVTNSFWKLLCGHPADSLERSTENENEYMIFDNDPLISKFIAPPRDLASLNCSIFYGGMIGAILFSNGFDSKISAHSVSSNEYPNRTLFLIKLINKK